MFVVSRHFLEDGEEEEEEEFHNGSLFLLLKSKTKHVGRWADFKQSVKICSLAFSSEKKFVVDDNRRRI